MKKKIILLICLTFFLCGCTVNYNLSIKDGKIIENFDILGQDNISTRDMIDTNFSSNIIAKYSQMSDDDSNVKIDGISYYEVSKTYKNGLLGLNYNYEFNFYDFYDSSAINECYEYFNIINSDDILTISTGKENKCIQGVIDSLIVNIQTEYKVIDNNANSVDGHTYTWNITKDNYSDNNIYIKVNTKEKADKLPEEIEKEEKILKIFATVGIILVVFAALFTLFLISKRKKLEND